MPRRWSKKTRVFIDTCSLMHAKAADVLSSMIEPRLRANGLKLIIAKKVVEELNSLSIDQSRSTSTRDKAERGKDLVRHLQKCNVAKFFGEEGDTFADNLFQVVFLKLCFKYELVLITQDKGLAKDILRLNHRDSVNRAHRFEVFSFGNKGELRQWQLDGNNKNGISHQKIESGPSQTQVQSRSGKQSNGRSSANLKPFRKVKRPVALNNTPVSLTSVPELGGIVVNTKGRHLRLKELLGKGGEGSAYLTTTNQVAKIYNRGQLTQSTLDKLKLMVSRQVDNPAICWPKELVTNSNGEVVGYLMRRAKGWELKKSVFIKPLLKQKFPNWNRRNIVRLAQNILRAIDHLHSMNVLVGDLNGRNILIHDDRSVHLVDCDSYQIEGYPCPVGMPPFLSPELHGEKLSKKLRTLESEQFAIATLMFMLIHPGKPPYSHQGGEDPSKNVRKQHFPYPLADQHGEGVPNGPWRFMWSHLPFYLKESFHKVFSDNKRLPLEDWMQLLRRYDNDLRKGYVSDEIYPTGFKQLNRKQVESKGGTWKVCSSCGQGFGAFRTHHILCRTCNHKRIRQQETSSKKRSQSRPSPQTKRQPQPRRQSQTIHQPPHQKNSKQRQSPIHTPNNPPNETRSSFWQWIIKSLT